MSLANYKEELDIALKAVTRAMKVTRIIQQEMTSGDTLTKNDRSPVTVADFTSQAIICSILKKAFPGIPIVAEEDSAALQEDRNRDIRGRILHYLENCSDFQQPLSARDLYHSIDLGGSSPSRDLFWTLDPIDGTKGFLRGEQFAIALALIRKGRVVLGVLGCPRLSAPDQQSPEGILLFARRGDGAYYRTPGTEENRTCRISQESDPTHMRFVESYVSAHSNMDMQLKVARALHISGDPVQMDSQVKYAVVSSGQAEIYLRIPHPKTPDYKEKIWDHAAGSLIVEEAGGVVSDIRGNRLDFGAGKTLANNTGIVAAVPQIYPRIVEVISSNGKGAE